KAPVHLLVIPKRHIESIARIEPGDEGLVGHCVRVARLLAERLGYGERGYRFSCNTGPEGGQGVYHLHFHLTAGRGGCSSSATCPSALRVGRSRSTASPSMSPQASSSRSLDRAEPASRHSSGRSTGSWRPAREPSP